jgi:tripartite-type tricarboxylate transporter receptor subunit TctC
MTRRKLLATGLGFVLATCLTVDSPRAEDYPSQPITVLIGFGAGGMTDVSSRIIADKLASVLGVRVLVENRPGAGGLVALDAAEQSPADGYTFVSFLSDAPFTSVFQNRPIDLDDWTMIGGYMPQERVLFARTDAPFDTVEELIEHAKETPVTFADGGAFWSARVMEAFAKKHDINIRLVPFRSGAEGSAAILGGHVTLAETGVGTSAWHAARDDGLKILATLTPGGLSAFGYDDVPTFEELNADYVVRINYGYAVRGDTPPDRVEKLSDAIRQVVEDPEVQESLRAIDLTPEWMSGEEYSELMQEIFSSGQALKAYLEE